MINNYKWKRTKERQGVYKIIWGVDGLGISLNGIQERAAGSCNNSSVEKGVVFEARGVGVYESITYKNRLTRKTSIREDVTCGHMTSTKLENW